MVVGAHLHELLKIAAAALCHDDVHVVGVLIHALEAHRIAVLLKPAHADATLLAHIYKLNRTEFPMV